MTWEEWYEYVKRRGMHGDVMYDVLLDWKKDRARLVEENRKLYATVKVAREYRKAHLAVEVGSADFNLQHAQVMMLNRAAKRLDRMITAVLGEVTCYTEEVL